MTKKRLQETDEGWYLHDCGQWVHDEKAPCSVCPGPNQFRPNPWEKRIAKQGAGRSGVRAEARAAKRTGAKLTFLSGSRANARGDMDLKGFKIELKTTVNGSLSLPLDWLAKITGEAERAGKTPALMVNFVNGDGTPRRDGKWVMVPEAVFEEMTHGHEARQRLSDES